MSLKFKNGDEFVKNLVKTYCPSPSISSTIRLDTYYTKAHSMFCDALDAVKEGKDARAYIALMRYAQLVSALTKHSNYNAKQYEKERNANKRRLHNAIIKLEELKPKIVKMYNAKIQKEKEEQTQPTPKDTNPSKVIEPKQSIESIVPDPSVTDSTIEEPPRTEAKTEEEHIEMPPAPPPNIRQINKTTAKYGKKRRKSQQFGFRIKIQSEDGDEKDMMDDEAQSEKTKDGVLAVGWNSKEDKQRKKAKKIKRKQKRTHYDGWSVSDVCWINGKEYVIKKIHFDTKPPTLTVELKSDEERKFVTEFGLISRKSPVNINNTNSAQVAAAINSADSSSSKQMVSKMDNNDNNTIHQRPMPLNNNYGHNTTMNHTQTPKYMQRQRMEKKVNRNESKIRMNNSNAKQRPMYTNNNYGNGMNQRTNASDNNSTNHGHNNIPQRNMSHQQQPMYTNNNYNATHANRRTKPNNSNTNINRNNQRAMYRNTYNNAQTQKHVNNQPTAKSRNHHHQQHAMYGNNKVHNTTSNQNSNQQPMYRNHNRSNHQSNTNRNVMHQNNQKGPYMNHTNKKQLPPKPEMNHHAQYAGFKPPPPNVRNRPKKQLPPKQPKKPLPSQKQNNAPNDVWNVNENASDDSDDEDYKKNKVLASCKKRRSSINYDVSDQPRRRRGSVFEESSSDDDDGNGTGRRLSVDISNAPITAVSAHVNFN